MAECDIGIYGLAVMGQNLVLNAADHGFKVAIYNRTKSKIDDFMEDKVDDRPVEAAYELGDFVQLIKKPRVVLLIVKAGPAVDAVIDQLKPHLEAGDIIIDGGNSYFKDTERRTKALAEDNIQYVGMGVSGGEEGARYGPSLMPGGTRDSYDRIQPILEAVAADAEGEPCVAYLGPRGAGHYVKMVHNGIEYGNMQAIAEVYDILHRLGGLEPDEMGEIFQTWNEGVLSSYLVEITGDILKYVDPDSGTPLIDLILDQAKQKGTGKWTTQDALDLGVSVPTISAAVDARIISGLKQERGQAATVLKGPSPDEQGTEADLVKILEQALLATMICSYAQGFVALRFASEEYDYSLDLATVARIWRDGCIIRAGMLNEMSDAFTNNIGLPNLMVDAHFAQLLEESQDGWRQAIKIAIDAGIPTPAMSSALAYYDSYRSVRLPANMIQAQRDYFGAHTYQRIDSDEQFHTEWQSH